MKKGYSQVKRFYNKEAKKSKAKAQGQKGDDAVPDDQPQ